MTSELTTVEQPSMVQSRVREWLQRIEDARKHFDKVFRRMREDMEFLAGLQWRSGTDNPDEDDRYVANLTLRNISQKVASLYARNPTAVAVIRDRLSFSLWDGRIETLTMAYQRVEAASQSGTVPDPNDLQLLADYQHGKQMEEIIERVGASLEVVYQYQVDSQEPEFKKQMKQLVRRTVACGVGYVKLVLENEHTPPMTGDGPAPAFSVRLRELMNLVEEIKEKGTGDGDVRLGQLHELLVGMTVPPPEGSFTERLLFSFPSSRSIIPDPKLRCLKDFVGADWVAERFVRPRSEVESYFEVKLGDGRVRITNQQGGEVTPVESQSTSDDFVTCYEVYDKRTRSRFIICEGYDGYLLPPEPVVPKTKRFWPWFALTFNDIEAEAGDENLTPFPPSDVQLLRPIQKEWNRSRQALREHRQGSVPFYVTTAPLSDEDVAHLKTVAPGDVIRLQGLPANSDASRVLVAFQPAKIDPLVYDTSHLQQDILFSLGMQEANLGPTSGATATESTIAEQSRLAASSSNADDVDDLLSDLARAGSELLLRGMSEATAKRIGGPGTVWPPPEMVEDFVNEVFLVVEAASSGRPNQALEVAKFERVAPHLVAAGANPHWLIKWGAKVADIKVPMDEAFPLVPSTGVPEKRAGALNAPNTLRAEKP